jgi:hypothetical protein
MRPRRRTRTLLGFAVLLVGALTALAIGTNHSARSHDTIAQPDASRPAAQQGADQSGALRREVALLRREVMAARLRGADEPQPESEAAPANEVERERLVAESDERARAQAEASDAALRAEPDDPAWSTRARDLIATTFSNEVLKATKVLDVDCRATLCRVRVINPDPRARMVFEHHFTLAVGQLLPQVLAQTTQHEDGSATSIVYLAREGHSFPSPGSPAAGG